jgi:hypothetical protein
MSDSKRDELIERVQRERTWQDLLAGTSLTCLTVGTGSFLKEDDPRKVAKLAHAIAPKAAFVGAVSGVAYFLTKWRADRWQRQIDADPSTAREDAGRLLHADKVQARNSNEPPRPGSMPVGTAR